MYVCVSLYACSFAVDPECALSVRCCVHIRMHVYVCVCVCVCPPVRRLVCLWRDRVLHSQYVYLCGVYVCERVPHGHGHGHVYVP